MAQIILNGRQARWLLQLISYDFIIYYRWGALNPANGLLQRPDYFIDRVEDSVIDKLMPSLTNKLAVKNTVALEADVQCRESISLECGGDSPPTEDLIRVLSLQVIIWSKARLIADNLVPFTEAKLSNLTVSNNADSGDSEL